MTSRAVPKMPKLETEPAETEPAEDKPTEPAEDKPTEPTEAEPAEDKEAPEGPQQVAADPLAGMSPNEKLNVVTEGLAGSPPPLKKPVRSPTPNELINEPKAAA